MTKLSDMPQELSTNHTAQIKWLNGQMAKNNGSIFLNQQKAESAYQKLLNENLGQIENKDLEKFTARYLSDQGIRKLKTTIRVAETRAKKKGFRLQCNIKYKNNEKLESLMEGVGIKNKGELIDKLIELAEITDIERYKETEKQLEITL